jgi:hypothetical protein
MFYAPNAFTVSSVSYVVSGATGSTVAFSLGWNATRTSAQTVIYGATGTLTGVSTTSGLTNTAVSAGSWVWVTTSASSATSTELNVTLGT